MHRLFTRFLLTAIVALFSRAAFAEPDLLLYFQISDSPQFDNSDDTCSYDFAMVSFTTDGTNPSGGYLDLYADGETVSQGQALASGSDAAYASLGSKPSAESQILFELWSWSDSDNSFERVGYYTALYSDLIGNIMESGGVSPATPLMITQVHAQAVPEPTSGLLVLLGAAVLALRRKRI